MTGDIVAQGVELMLYGMGTVVVFLALLVVVTALMSSVMSRFFPQPEVAAPAPRPRAPSSAGAAEGEVVAAISAAVRQHRSKQ